MALENAIFNNAAIGGSTNAVIHLLPLAKRIAVARAFEDWDRLGSNLPCLVDLQPSGKHLMEDFYDAGGVPAVLRELGEAGVLNPDALTANGDVVTHPAKGRRNTVCETGAALMNLACL